jgi:minor histocompatibility antigen H13
MLQSCGSENDIRRLCCSTFGGYVAGLVSTILVMNVFKAAQPALLYLVPAIIGALALHSSLLKSFKKVRYYTHTA